MLHSLQSTAHSDRQNSAGHQVGGDISIQSFPDSSPAARFLVGLPGSWPSDISGFESTLNVTYEIDA